MERVDATVERDDHASDHGRAELGPVGAYVELLPRDVEARGARLGVRLAAVRHGHGRRATDLREMLQKGVVVGLAEGELGTSKGITCNN